MSRLDVIYQFNEKYVPYAGVSMTSLFVNNRDVDTVNVYVLGEGLSSESCDMICEMADKYGAHVIFPETQLLINRFRQMGMIPYRGAYSVYLRLFFDELVGADVKRAIYVDADTIIDASLIPLVEHDLGGKSIGMVLESIRDDYKVMIGMQPDSDYYNSGVILYDVEKWRESKYGEKLVDHIRNVRSSYIGDQDFLNIVTAGDVCRLPLKYNFQPLHRRYTIRQYFKAYPLRHGASSSEYYSFSDIKEAASGAVIYHCYRWIGEFPWNKGNLHPFNDKFDKYLSKSLWRDYVKEKADTGIVIRIEKIMYRLLPRILFIHVFKWAHESMLRRAENDARQQRANESA